MNNIKDLILDDKNFNRGNGRGKKLIDKSFKKFGAGRSILVDKNMKVIAGNKSVEAFGEMGLEDVQIVESDGKRLIAVKRTDIDLDTKEGRELALADNRTSEAGLEWNLDLIGEELGQDIALDWGIELPSPLEIKEDNFDEPKVIEITKLGDKYKLSAQGLEHILVCGDATVSDSYNEFVNKGGGNISSNRPSV